jgi:hypothetical protein
MLKIIHFTDYKKLEEFYNNYSAKKKIESKDIKIVVVKGKVVYFLIVEFQKTKK